MPDLEVPLSARVALAHAAVQASADARGVRLLHVKGHAASEVVRPHQRTGTDVDVMVDPGRVEDFVATMLASGWRQDTGFTTGSAFDHAALFYHESWGLLDAHRTFPGLDKDPVDTFETLWASHENATVAHYPIPTPDETAQSLIILLHAARTDSMAAQADIKHNWDDASEARRAEIDELAQRLGAEVALAAVTGRLDDYGDSPEAALWRHFQSGGGRLDEWAARWSAARGVQAKSSLAWRALWPNRYYLEQKLGHPPSRAELMTETFRRYGAFARSAGERALRRIT